MAYHDRKKEDVLTELDVTVKAGLSDAEVAIRLKKFGPNKISIGKKKNPLIIFLNQFKNFLVIVLILAAIASFAIGFLPGQEPEYENAILILIIVFFNGIFGFIQDYKAEKSIEALKEINTSKARVIRSGKQHLINSEDLVPGDIVLIESGEKISADLRIIESDYLTIDESILTGESVPVNKQSELINSDTQLADRVNMAYMNTICTIGSGKGVVIATGKTTEVGKIAEELFLAPEKKSAFTLELDKLGKKLGWFIMGLILIIAITQLFMGNLDPFMVFMIAVSLGVAAIPEGLPAVVTLSMAFGTKKMLKQKALVRKLSVVESLGSVDLICTDKTGTLTENRMTVREIYYKGKRYNVTGNGHEIKGSILFKNKKINSNELNPLLVCGLNCNNASPGVDENNKSIFIGDPTEVALLVSAAKLGIVEPQKRLHEIPFSSDTKVMVTVNKSRGKTIAYLKGAPEQVLRKCPQLSVKENYQVLNTNNEMAKRALRVLGFGVKNIPNDYTDKDFESGFTFLGLQAMIDPPRIGVRESIDVCINAGIGIKMITGDNMLTALAIAREIGLGQVAINGKELDSLSDVELRSRVETIDIFARVTPSHKVRVLKALQANGHLVAMTGDGVNDAPALKNADVSIGMAMRGSDLAKESSEMVLLDDNFVTIKNAIREGRTIFNNIRKFVNYLLTSNIAEVMVVFIISLFGKLPILPVQLLWINLLTDGLPAIALGVDPPLDHLMKQKPKHEGIINKNMMIMILGIGFVITCLVIPLFFSGLREGIQKAQTMVFTGLVVYELLRILVIRAQEHLSLWSNKYLLVAILVSISLQLLVVYSPLRRFFGTVPLSPFDWWLIVGLGAVGYIVSLVFANFVTTKVRQ